MRSSFILEEHCVTTRVDNFFGWLKRWSQSRSLWPLLFGSGISAVELHSLFGSRYDIERLGIDGIKYLPAQADLLIVTGPVTKKSFPILKNIYDQMTEPKWVMALGSEAISGGMFNNHTIEKDWMKDIPVDVKVPGHPPTPESIIQGLLFLRERIEKGVVMEEAQRSEN